MNTTDSLVEVRTFKEEYISSYLDMFSPKVQELLGVVSPFDEKTYLQCQLQKAQQNQTSLYGIFERQSGTLIGSFEIKSPSYRSQLSMWLHEDYWGKGYFQQAFMLLKQIYFSAHPEQQFFSAYVDQINQRSYKALIKAGCLLKSSDNYRYYVECYT